MTASQTTSDRVLLHLKTIGQDTAQGVATAFGITHMGAHKALQGLQDGGYIQFTDVAEGRGRPRRYYRLSEDGHGRFPDRHADLTVEIIKHVRDLFGPKGLDQLVAAREAEQRARYAENNAEQLEDRLERLVGMRSEEGYMARMEKDGDDYLLIEDHCPICAAAEACQGFCRSELAIFRMVLGDEVDVQREEHVPSGGRRCAYRIRQLAAS